MKTTRRRLIHLALLLALPACGGAATEETSSVVATIRTGAVRKLISARPFTVAQPYVHRWRHEQPSVSAGWILVLEVDPSMTEPHQRAIPVLLVGDQTVECVNSGQPSGNVVAIVPAPVDESRFETWFGPPDLPERVDAGWIAAARAGVPAEQRTTFSAAEIASARGRGGAALQVADRVELEHEAARLILEHSPEERELAESLLVPLIK